MVRLLLSKTQFRLKTIENTPEVFIQPLKVKGLDHLDEKYTYFSLIFDSFNNL